MAMRAFVVEIGANLGGVVGTGCIRHQPFTLLGRGSHFDEARLLGQNRCFADVLVGTVQQQWCLGWKAIFFGELVNFRLEFIQGFVDLILQLRLVFGDGDGHLTTQAFARDGQHLPAVLMQGLVVKACTGAPEQSQVDLTLFQGGKGLFLAAKGRRQVTAARAGKQDGRWRTKQHAHTFALEV